MVQLAGADTKLPRINEVVWLLEKFDPDALETLKSQYPEDSDLLTSGIRLGGKSASSESGTRVRSAAALKGLTRGISVCEQTIPEIRRRLKRAGSLRFASEVVTVVAGASIFTVLATNFQNAVRYAVASLALFGSLLALTATYFGGTLHSSGSGLLDYYKELIDCQIDAKQILQELEVWRRSDLTDSSIESAIRESNEICSRIMKASSLAS